MSSTWLSGMFRRAVPMSPDVARTTVEYSPDLDPVSSTATHEAETRPEHPLVDTRDRGGLQGRSVMPSYLPQRPRDLTVPLGEVVAQYEAIDSRISSLGHAAAAEARGEGGRPDLAGAPTIEPGVPANGTFTEVYFDADIDSPAAAAYQAKIGISAPRDPASRVAEHAIGIGRIRSRVAAEQGSSWLELAR